MNTLCKYLTIPYVSDIFLDDAFRIIEWIFCDIVYLHMHMFADTYIFREKMLDLGS